MEGCVEGWLDFSALLRPAVYALLVRGRVVYVGQSKCPLVRIYTHRSMAGRRAPAWLRSRGIVFDGVKLLPTRVEDLDRVEQELIAYYKPKFNVHDKPKVDVWALIAAPKFKMERRV